MAALARPVAHSAVAWRFDHEVSSGYCIRCLTWPCAALRSSDRHKYVALLDFHLQIVADRSWAPAFDSL